MIGHPPKKIIFLTDGCEVELTSKPAKKTNKAGEEFFIYRYTKAKENIGKEIPISLNQIEYLNRIHFIIIS